MLLKTLKKYFWKISSKQIYEMVIQQNNRTSDDIPEMKTFLRL